MRIALWPDESVEELHADCVAYFEAAGWRKHVLIGLDTDGRPAGMIELSLRDHAEGCEASPVPFIEGWFVHEDRRRRGLGRALVRAAEVWAREQGLAELGSDAQVWNTASQAAQEALGFQEVERIVAYRKALN